MELRLLRHWPTYVCPRGVAGGPPETPSHRPENSGCNQAMCVKNRTTIATRNGFIVQQGRDGAGNRWSIAESGHRGQGILPAGLSYDGLVLSTVNQVALLSQV